MSKFIEVTDPKGQRIMVNTSSIVSVSDVHGNWGVEFAGDNNFKYVPSACLVVNHSDSISVDWFVLETYEEIKLMVV